MSQISRQLLRRWAAQPIGSTCEETFRKIASMVSGSTDRRKCLGVITTIVGTFKPKQGGGEPPPVPPLDLWKVFGRVSLSYHGGYLCADHPVIDLSIANQIEGMVNPFKQLALQAPGLFVVGDEPVPITVRHSFVLAFADRFFSQGSTAAKRIMDKAFPASMMGADSNYRLVLGDGSQYPAGWDFDTLKGWDVYVWAIYQEDPTPVPPMFQRIGTYMTSEDPALIPSGFSKLESLFVMDKTYKAIPEIAFPAALGHRVKLSVDDKPIYEDLNIGEDILTEAWMRDEPFRFLDVLPGLVIPPPFSDLIQPLKDRALVLWDQFESDRRSDLPAGNKWEVTGLGEIAADQLRYTYRRIDVTPAGEFNVWSERENVKISPSDLSQMSVNGDSVASIGMSRGQMLGLPIAIKTPRK